MGGAIAFIVGIRSDYCEHDAEERIRAADEVNGLHAELTERNRVEEFVEHASEVEKR